MLPVDVACRCCCFAIAGCQALLSMHCVVLVSWDYNGSVAFSAQCSSPCGCDMVARHAASLWLCVSVRVCRCQWCCSVCRAQDSGWLDSQSLGARCAGELALLPFWMFECIEQKATSYKALANNCKARILQKILHLCMASLQTQYLSSSTQAQWATLTTIAPCGGCIYFYTNTNITNLCVSDRKTTTTQN